MTESRQRLPLSLVISMHTGTELVFVSELSALMDQEETDEAKYDAIAHDPMTADAQELNDIQQGIERNLDQQHWLHCAVALVGDHAFTTKAREFYELYQNAQAYYDPLGTDARIMVRIEELLNETIPGLHAPLCLHDLFVAWLAVQEIGQQVLARQD